MALERGHVDIAAALIKAGANPDVTGGSGMTALHHAVQRSDRDALQCLLKGQLSEAGHTYGQATLDKTDSAGITPFYLAARLGRYDMASQLLDHGASLSACDAEKTSVLHLAALSGDMTLMHVLLKQRGIGSLIDMPNAKGSTPLHLAVKHGHRAAVDALIQASADVRAADHLGFSVLHYAVRQGDVDTVITLLHHGASVEAVAQGGVRPLLSAARAGNLNVVRALIGAGADLGAADLRGGTALHQAAIQGHAELIPLLIRQGAPREARAEAGFTPLHFAAARGHWPVIQRLIESDVDLYARTYPEGFEAGLDWAVLSDGLTCMHLAAQHNQGAVIAQLAERAPQLLALLGPEDTTPLHWAAQAGANDAVMALLARNADPNALDDSDASVLDYAAHGGHVNVIETLLSNGCTLA